MDMELDLHLELTPSPKNDLTLVLCLVIKTLNGSHYKNVWLVPEVHISGIHEKKFKMEFIAEKGIDQ